MRKLLSILASVGLVATSSTAVVACSVKQGVLHDATVDDQGNVTFTIKHLVMKDNYDSINRVNAFYGVFDKNGNHIQGSSITSADGVASFKRDKQYNFTGTFKIANYDASKKYTFKFGTFGKKDKMAKSFGTIIVKAGNSNVNPNPNPNPKPTPKVPGQGEGSSITYKEGSVSVELSEMPTGCEQLVKIFDIKNGDKSIKDVKMSFSNATPLKGTNAKEEFDENNVIKGVLTVDIPSTSDSSSIKSVKIAVAKDSPINVISVPSSMDVNNFTVDTMTLSGESLGKLQGPGANEGMIDYYISRPAMISSLTEAGAKRVFIGLFGNDEAKKITGSFVKALLDKNDKNLIEYNGVQKASITSENVESDSVTFGSQPGAEQAGWDMIKPKGKDYYYEIGFYAPTDKDGNTLPGNKSKHYWVYLNFDKTI